MIDRSRILCIDIFSVRGIGVAVRVKMSTWLRSDLIFSFWRTPKRCSSSMIIMPRWAKLISVCSSLCVLIKMSVLPDSTVVIIACCSRWVLNRDSASIEMGQLAKRSRKFSKCCCASSVVGTKIATCLPLLTAVKAARIATSVLPKPTSPQTNLSIGCALSKSRRTASMASR